MSLKVFEETGKLAQAPGGMTRLEVVSVGSFEASYVPTVGDFARLDARFRLPEGTWEQLPQYKDYGFAVFKLKPGERRIHPMAFSFPRADVRRLFFPTVHIHDGKVHATATFDHTLYYQKAPGETFSLRFWNESFPLAKQFLDIPKSKGIVLPDTHCYKMEMRGRRANADTWAG